MLCHRRFLFSLALCLITTGAQASPAPAARKYTLVDLVNLAVSNARILGSQDARAAEHRFSAAQARAWPGLSADFSAGRKSDGPDSGPRFELGLSQPLPIFGKAGLRARVLELEADSFAIARSEAQNAVSLAVVGLSYEYAVNRRKTEFAETRRKRFELVHEYLAGRVFATPQKKAESHVVQNRVKVLASAAVESQAAVKSALESLKAYTPLESDFDIEVRWFTGAAKLDGKEWLTRAQENNPGLRGRRLAVMSAQAEKDLATKERLPDPGLLASFEQSKTIDTEKNYGLGLSLALPYWNGNKAAIQSAEQKRLAEEHILAFDEQRLKADVSRALVRYETARQVIEKFPNDVLPGLEAQLKDAEEGFKRGQVDLLTFLELEDSVAEIYGRALDAQLNQAERISELLGAVGEPDVLSRLGSF